MPKIHVLHENPLWLPPFAEAFEKRGLPWTEWFLDESVFDLSEPPPEGVFYNRMSASSHTRDHRHSPELTAAVLAWLARHGRKVVNGSPALDLEINKARQYAGLEKAGVTVPRTILVGGKTRIVEAARKHFAGQPVILKPNRGGKGLGVQLFRDLDTLEAHVNGPDYIAPVDGLSLLQEYILAPEPFITRAEFIGGRFLYAVRVDTSDGFELCPAEACAIGDAACPVGQAPRNKFEVLPGIDEGLKQKLESFLAAAKVDVAGIEFITTSDGRILVYDVNTNTNYNPEAEARAGVAGTDRSGPGALAAYLERELRSPLRAAA
ncbi:alpha-L-glutamate ligase [Acetobacteraceae bacterium H6797]|nr:alpha-L-glutamate ligase [Acetobacteraceae bacterium H6797]